MLSKACNNLNQGSTQSSLPTQPPARGIAYRSCSNTQPGFSQLNTLEWNLQNYLYPITEIKSQGSKHCPTLPTPKCQQWLYFSDSFATNHQSHAQHSTTHQLFLCALFRQRKHKHQTPLWNSNKFCLRSSFSSPSKETWLLVLSSFPLLNITSTNLDLMLS